MITLRQAVFLVLLVRPSFCVQHRFQRSGQEPPVSQPQTRVAGGEAASDSTGTFPYVASLQMSVVNTVTGEPIGKYLCSGSLVAPLTVLTAAHCVDFLQLNGTIQKLIVLLGWNDVTRFKGDPSVPPPPEEPLAEVYSATRWFPHELYAGVVNLGEAQWEDYDIGLVRLPTNSRIRPVLVDFTGAYTTPGYGVIAAGYGEAANEQGTEVIWPTSVHFVRLSILRDHYCSLLYGADYDPSRQMCAGALNGVHHSTCGGDSGGPLLAGVARAGDPKSAAKFGSAGVVVAMTSYASEGCASVSTPNVYTRLAPYNSWLRKKIRGALVNYTAPSSRVPSPPPGVSRAFFPSAGATFCAVVPFSPADSDPVYVDCGVFPIAAVNDATIAPTYSGACGAVNGSSTD